MLYQLFQLACTQHDDPKHKGNKRWALDRDGLEFAFKVYGITELPRALRLVSQACAIMNGRR